MLGKGKLSDGTSARSNKPLLQAGDASPPDKAVNSRPQGLSALKLSSTGRLSGHKISRAVCDSRRAVDASSPLEKR